MRVQLAPRIIVDPDIRCGKPVIEGTRVPAELIVGKLAGGMAVDDVADGYGIPRADVLATLRYAEHLISRKRIRGQIVQRFVG